MAKTRKSLQPFRTTQAFYYQIFQKKSMLELKMPNTVFRKQNKTKTTTKKKVKKKQL